MAGLNADMARLTLLSPELTERPELDGDALRGADALRFVGTAQLGGVRITPVTSDPPLARVVALRVLFAGCAETDTWNSWVRAPTLPRRGSLSLWADGTRLPIEERRFEASHTGAHPGDATLIELRLREALPETLEALELRFPPGPHVLLRVELADAPWTGPPLRTRFAPEPAGSGYPSPQPQLPRSGDALAEQLAQRLAKTGRHEPQAGDLRMLALPYRGGALLGVPEGPLACHLWDGGLVYPEREGEFDRVWLKLDLGPLTDGPACTEQALLDGFLPAATARSEHGGVTLEQLAFVDTDGALRVRWQLRNGSAQTFDLHLRCRAQRARIAASPSDKAVRVAVFQAVPVQTVGARLVIGTRVATWERLPDSAHVPPGGEATLELCVPLGPALAPGLTPAHRFDEALAAVRSDCGAYLAEGGVHVDLPDPALMRAFRALCLHNRLFERDGRLRYGVFPSVYDGAIFGVEEGWNIVALAQTGHAAAAQRTLRNTFFDADFLAKDGQHHQYRNGLALHYALEVFDLTRDRDALSELWPTVRDSAEWIAAAFQSTQLTEPDGSRPIHFGMMPRHTYGGDLRDPAYSFYGSSACWRGLRDAALIAEALEKPEAGRWREQAATARGHLVTAASRVLRSDTDPPFLPFRTDEPGTEPTAGDYHQLFASLVLETAVFGWSGPLPRVLTEHLLRTGRHVLGLPRFDPWFGRLGLDAEYSRGTQLHALHARAFERFHRTLLAHLTLSADPHTFVSPETMQVLFSPQEHHERMRTVAEQPQRFDSDPCSAGTAILLQSLRNLLVFEERDDDDRPTGALWLGAAAPPSWFRAGRSFGARLPTACGEVSFQCHSDGVASSYRVQTKRPTWVEAFFTDAAGRRRSRRALVDGTASVTVGGG